MTSRANLHAQKGCAETISANVLKSDAFDSKVNLPGVIYDSLAAIKTAIVYSETGGRHTFYS